MRLSVTARVSACQSRRSRRQGRTWATLLGLQKIDFQKTAARMCEFPLLRVKTLLIVGHRDRTAIGKAWAPESVQTKMGNYPVLGRKAARAIPGAKLVEIVNAGHLPQVEAFPEYIEALSKFLASDAGAGSQ